MLADALTMSQLFLDFKLDNDLILHINKEKGKYAGPICTLWMLACSLFLHCRNDHTTWTLPRSKKRNRPCSSQMLYFLKVWSCLGLINPKISYSFYNCPASISWDFLWFLQLSCLRFLRFLVAFTTLLPPFPKGWDSSDRTLHQFCFVCWQTSKRLSPFALTSG